MIRFIVFAALMATLLFAWFGFDMYEPLYSYSWPDSRVMTRDMFEHVLSPTLDRLLALAGLTAAIHVFKRKR